MKPKGNKLLKVTGVLEILMGGLTIAFLLFLLSRNDTLSFLTKEIEYQSFKELIVLYVICGVEIFAGLFGIILSNKAKCGTFLAILGYLLLLGYVISNMFVISKGINVYSIIIDFVTLLIPVFYLHGALLNKREN